MADNDNRRKLYDNINKEYDLPDYDQFSKDMEDDTKRKKLYDAVAKEYDLPDYNKFSQDMGYGQQQASTNTQQNVQQSAQTAQKPQTQQPQQTAAVDNRNAEKSYEEQKAAYDKQYAETYNKLAKEGRVRMGIENHPNVKMVAVTDDLVKKFPQLEQSRGYQVPFDMNYGTPIMQNLNDKGDIITPEEAREQNTKILTGQNFDYVPQQETAAVQVGNVIKTSLDPRGGWLDNITKGSLEYAYGKDWRDKKYEINGKEVGANDMYARTKQELYDDINTGIGNIRQSLLFATDEQKKETVDQLYEKGYLKEDILPKGTVLHYIMNVGKDEQLEELKQRRTKAQVQKEMVQDRLQQMPERQEGETTNDFYDRSLSEGALYRSDLRKLDKQINQYDAVIDELEGKNTSGREWEHAIKTSGITTLGAWDFGATDLKDAMAIQPLARKLEKGDNISQADYIGLKILSQANDADAVEGALMPSSYNIKKGGLVSAPFTLQFMLTGDIAQGATTAVNRTVTRGVKGAIYKAAGKKALGAAERFAEKAASNKVVGFFGMLGKDFEKAFVMENTTGAATTGAEILNRRNGTVTETDRGFDWQGETLPMAIYKGEMSQNIELQTEFLGEHFPSSLKFIRNMAHTKVGSAMGLRNMAAWLSKLSRKDFAQTIRSYATKGGINGLWGEYMEEIAGTAENALLVGDQKFSDLLDPKQQWETFGSVALSCIGMGIFGTAAYTGQRGLNMPRYYQMKHLQNKWENTAMDLFSGDEWAQMKQKIDNTPNENAGELLASIVKDQKLTEQQARAAFNYARCMLTLRGMNIGTMKAAQLGLTDDKTIEQDQAYVEGREAADEDKHDVQIEYEDKTKELADRLGISEQQLANMSDEELESLTGNDDNLDNLIYDYQTAHAKYQGVMDNADDNIDMAAQQAARQTDMVTDKNRGTVRNATIKATRGEEDYGVYIVSGNVSTNKDGTINISESDNMILYYDPQTRKIEHADASRFSSIGEEVNAEEAKNKAIADAKEKAIRKEAGIIDGTVGEGSSFTITDADGNEHTYEVLADNGDGTAMITLDGNVQNAPVSIEDLQKLKDAEDAKRLEAAKLERQQHEMEREQQREKDNAPVEDNLDYSDIVNNDGKVEIADVVDEDGNSMFPDAQQVFFIQSQGNRAKVMVLDNEGNLKSKLVKKAAVKSLGTMSVDEYKQERLQALKESGNASETSSVEEDRGKNESDGYTLSDKNASNGEQFYQDANGNIDLVNIPDEVFDAIGYERAPFRLTPSMLNHIKSRHGKETGITTDSEAIKFVIDVLKNFDHVRLGYDGALIFSIENGRNRTGKRAVTILINSNDGGFYGVKSSGYESLKGLEKRTLLWERGANETSTTAAATASVTTNESQLSSEQSGSASHQSNVEKGIATNPTSASHGVEGSELAAPNDSQGKDTSNEANKQENSEKITLEDGTEVPMKEDGNPDFSQLTAKQTAELYDTQFGEDAEQIISDNVAKSKKALDKANGMTVKGGSFVEQKASKEAKDKAIAEAQERYDSAKAVADAYNERQLAKEEDTPEGRQNLIEKARRKFNRMKSSVKDNAQAVAQLYNDTVGSLLHRLYDGTGIDVFDDVANTIEEYVASHIAPYSLSYDGTETSKGVKQETGLSRTDFAKTGFLAKEGKGKTIDKLAHELWQERPENLQDITDQDVRNAIIDLITSGETAFGLRNYIQDMRIAQAERVLEGQKRLADDLAYAEERNAEEEEQQPTGKTDNDMKGNSETSDDADTAPSDDAAEDNNPKMPFEAPSADDAPFSAKDETEEQSPEERQAFVEKNRVNDIKLVDDVIGKKLRKSLERIAKMMGAKIQWQRTDKKGNGWFNSDTNTIYLTLDSSITEGVQFIFGHEMTHEIKTKSPAMYDELKSLVKDRYGEDLYEGMTDDNEQKYTDAGIAGYDRSYYEEETVADAIGDMMNDLNLAHSLALKMSHPLLAKMHDVLQKIKTAFFGTEYTDKAKGIIRTIEQVYVKTANGTFESSSSEGGNEEKMSVRDANERFNNEIENFKNKSHKGLMHLGAPSPILKACGVDVDEITLSPKVLNRKLNQHSLMTEDVKDLVNAIQKPIMVYRHGEGTPNIVVITNAEIRGNKLSLALELDADGNVTKLNNVSSIHDKDAETEVKRWLTWDEGYLENALRWVDKEKVSDWLSSARLNSYSQTENNQKLSSLAKILNDFKNPNISEENVTNNDEKVSYSLRQKPEPEKKGIGYKVFVLGKDGKLYPPMVANPNGAATPVGVWLDADAAPIAGESKTGRPQVKQGGKGTQGGSGKLAYRPGWHLGVIPYALQFNRKDADGNKTLFPKNFVFAEVEYAADKDYQNEAHAEGINANGKYQHSLAGLKHLPTDGYYMYRTNPNPETDPWVITGAMKVNRLLTRAEQAELVRKAGREPQKIQDGDTVTDEVVNNINQEIANAPKFSLRVYHGSGADFTEFDFDHMGEGAGSQAFGWGGYVASSKEIGKSYAEIMDGDPTKVNYHYQYTAGQRFMKKYPTLESFLHGDKQIAKNDKFTEQEKIDYYNERKKQAEPYHNLYEVNIPDDNGENYLDWDAPLSDELIDKVANALPAIRSYDIEGFKKDRNFEDLYRTISMRIVEDENMESNGVFNDYKAASQLLSSLGYTGIKYKAGRNFGGAKEGDMNYVIFKPEDMQIVEHEKFSLKSNVDNQGNPLNADGTLKLDKIRSVDDLTDEDFTNATRNVQLPSIPQNVDVAIGANGKPIIIKKNIFEKNWNAHKFTPAESRKVLNDALYNTDLIGRSQPTKKPNHWVAIKLDDKSPITVLEVNDNKDNVEVVGWYTLDERNLGRIKRQAERNGGELIMLSPNDKVESLSTPPLNSAANVDKSSETSKQSREKFSLRLKNAIDETDTEPTDAQKKSGNYKKGHVKFGGYDYTIENPKGSYRSGVDENGKEWKQKMHDTYGYIRGKFGKDGDHLDMFINDKADLDSWNGTVYIVDQVNKDGSFDEHKVMYGYDSLNAAKEAYLSNYEKGWTGLGNISAVEKADFDKWLDRSNRKLKPFADYTSITSKSDTYSVPNSFEEFLEHPVVRFSIRNERERAAAEDAYNYAQENRPDKYSQYAIVDMDKPGAMPEYMEKKKAADNWRRYYNKMEWGNYKLFDLNKPFEDNVKNLVGKFPNTFRKENDDVLSRINKLTADYGNRLTEYLSMSKNIKIKMDDMLKTNPSSVDVAKQILQTQDYKDMISKYQELMRTLKQLNELKSGKVADGEKYSLKEVNDKFNNLLDNFTIENADKFVFDLGRPSTQLKAAGVTDKPIRLNGSKLAKKIRKHGFDPRELKNLPLAMENPIAVFDNLRREGNRSVLTELKTANGNFLVTIDLGKGTEADFDIVSSVFGKNGKGVVYWINHNMMKYVDKEKALNYLHLSAPIAEASDNSELYSAANIVRNFENPKKNEEKYSLKDEDRKQAQLDIILKTNPMLDDYHTGIRKVEDIKTLEESVEEARSEAEKYDYDEWSAYPDITNDMLQDALETGEITIYSSKAIKNGVFVTPSYMQASDYAGGGKVYEKTVPLTDVAWINTDEGQYAKVDGEKYSLIGKRGAANLDHEEEVSTRLDNLNVARQMEDAKKDAKAIKMATGWERGADGKWRYEIPDIKQIDLAGNLQYIKNHPDYARYEELVSKQNRFDFGLSNVGLTEAEQKEKEQLDKIYRDFTGRKMDNNYNLGAFIDAPELFGAYPKLADVKLNFVDNKNDEAGGWYSKSDNAIMINKANSSEWDYKSLLVHEIQHVIQHIEGFARGGDSKYIRKVLERRINENQDASDYAKDKLKDWATLTMAADRLSDLYKPYINSDNEWLKNKAIDSYWDAMNELDNNEQSTLRNDYPNGTAREIAESGYHVEEAEKELRRLAKETKESIPEGNMSALNLVSKLTDALENNDDYSLYHKLGGEVEARNVQSRMDMTPEERRNTLAEETEDVARKDQIFLYGNNEAYSLKGVNNQSLFDAIHTLYSKGKTFASQLFNMKYFDVAETPDFMKRLGLTGDKFTIRYGVISRHFGKDNQHDFTEEEWKQIPKALSNPILITEYYQDEQQKKQKGYRLYTPLKLSDGSYVVVSAEVKNAGRNLEINAINTIFGRNAISDIHDRVVYQNPKITPEQSSLLNGNNPHQYPNGQELSVANVDNSSESTKNNEEKFSLKAKDAEYLEAVRDGDMEKAQKMVDDAARAAGYVGGTDYQGEGSWNAPSASVEKEDFANLDALRESVEEYSGDTNVYGIINGVTTNDDDFYYNPGRVGFRDAAASETSSVLRKLRYDKADADTKVKVYRAVPIDVKGNELMSGDWIALSKQYCIDHGNGRYGEGNYRIVEEEVPIKTIWNDGNDMREFGFDDGNNNEAEKNVPNNRKLLDAVTYDDNGNVIPLSERFNEGNSDVRYSLKNSKADRIQKLRESKPVVITGREITPSDDLKQYKKNALEYGKTLRGTYRNEDTGEEIDLTGGNKRGGIREILQHDYKDIEHLQSIAAIPQIIKKSVFIDELPNEDRQHYPDVKSFRYYVCGLKIGEKDYTVKAVVAEQNNGNRYYDHRLTDIEKGKLLSILPTIQKAGTEGNLPNDSGFDTTSSTKLTTANLSVGKDKRLLSILQTNNTENVDKEKYSLRVDRYREELNQWKRDNNLPKDAERPQLPIREPNESAADFLKRVKEYRQQAALWATAPKYEQHLLTSDTAQGQFNLEMQRKAVLARITLQDSMLAIRKAQEAIMKEVGVDKLNFAEDAYTAENRSHGKGKNEFEEYNDEFLQPLRKAYNALMKRLGKSYDNVKVYMVAKHGLERNAHIAFKKALNEDYEKNEERIDAYNNYKADFDRMTNDADFEAGRIDFATWKQRDVSIRTKYAPSYSKYRFDEDGNTMDYSGLTALFDADDFEGAAADLVKDVEDNNKYDTEELWYATNAATRKILRDSYKAGMMTEDIYNFVRGMYNNYIPLRGWGDTNADQVWNYIGGGKGAFSQVVKEAKGRKSLADDPIAYIENMAESGILMNNRNWVKQHLLLLAENHSTSLLNVSKAWYIKTKDAQGNEEWIPASPQITAGMNSKQVEAALEAFEKNMEQMKQKGDATQKREQLEISYPQTNGEEREHEVRVMKNGEEYVIYINGDPQLAQAMNNTRARKVREGLKNSVSQRIIARTGRYMAAAYTSLSPLFIPSNYMRDLTMTLASTAIREDARYNYLLRRNMLRHWNTFPLVLRYQNGTLREKVRNGSASKVEQMFYDFMMNGGETGFVTSLDVEDLKKKFRNELKDMNRMAANPKKVGHVIMDSIETLNRAIEDSNRFMVYMTSIEYGRSIDEAVNNAKDVTLNFNRKGTGEHGWQTIRNLYLFINPAIQSLQTLGALAKHHPVKFSAVTTAWMASGVIVPLVNNLLMSFFGGDDDKDKYWQFTKWDRRNNCIMWVPFTHEFIKIPLAQEFRGFYGVGDMIASKLWGGEKAEESWGDYSLDLMGQIVDMLPLDPTGYDGNVAVSLMPNPIRPFFELAFNVDFTGKPLFKDSEYNKYDPNFTKAYVGTPEWLVRISRMVNSVGNDYTDVQQNWIDRAVNSRFNLNNPAVVDHVLSSYLGGAYTMGSQILGVMTKALNGDEIKMADIPLASKFVSNPDDRPVSKKQGDEFWNVKERHDRAANTLSKLKKKAKVDGDYSTLDMFFGSDEYKQYKEDDKVVKKYEEDRKKEKAQETGEEYKPHKTTGEDVYKQHATPRDDFEDMKMKQLYEKLNSYKLRYDAIDGISREKGDAYYKANKAAIEAIEEVAYDRSTISSIKKGFMYDGKDAYDAEGMKDIRELRRRILDILERANRNVVNSNK